MFHPHPNLCTYWGQLQLEELQALDLIYGISTEIPKQEERQKQEQ